MINAELITAGALDVDIGAAKLVQGPPGEAATVEIGTVTKGDVASVTNVGDDTHAILDFVLPKGDKGDTGEKGDQGDLGPRGATFTPSVDMETGMLTWTNDAAMPNPEPVNIRGPEGPQGQKGDTGAQGPKGDKGDTGPQGQTGPQGVQGEKGDTGDVGPQGPPGETGPAGPQGEQGPTGAQGPQGIPGETGPQGERGPKGDQGEKGDKGDTGAQGPKGDKGEKGDTGERGPQGYVFTPAVDGSGNLSWTNDGNLANPETVNIRGPKGDTGAKGETGSQGPRGEKGDTGDTGPQGATGERGPQGYTFTPVVDSEGNLSWTNDGALENPDTVNIKGPQGPQGPQGAKGDTGAQGPQGEKGDTGDTGPQGPKGETGNGFKIMGYYASLSALQEAIPSPEVGDAYGVGTQEPYDIYIWGGSSWVNNGPIQGPAGEQGPQGPQGDKGEKGDKGDTGPTGPTGATGATGATGPTGPTGPTGAAGQNATINGVNALTLNATGGLSGSQSGSTYTLDGSAFVQKTANLSGTDYTTVRARGISLVSSAPSTLANGCIAIVYS